MPIGGKRAYIIPLSGDSLGSAKKGVEARYQEVMESLRQRGGP